MGMIGSFNVVQGSAGIIESEHTEFTIYPNPASDILFIKMSEKKVNYKIWTQAGKLIGEGQVRVSSMISKLSIGSYFIEIVGDRPKVFSFSKK